MGENKQTIEIKQEKLRIELSKSNPNLMIVKRLKESIIRHKQIERGIKKRLKWKETYR